MQVIINQRVIKTKDVKFGSKLFCPTNPLTILLYKGFLQKTEEIFGTTNWTP